MNDQSCQKQSQNESKSNIDDTIKSYGSDNEKGSSPDCEQTYLAPGIRSLQQILQQAQTSSSQSASQSATTIEASSINNSCMSFELTVLRCEQQFQALFNTPQSLQSKDDKYSIFFICQDYHTHRFKNTPYAQIDVQKYISCQVPLEMLGFGQFGTVQRYFDRNDPVFGGHNAFKTLPFLEDWERAKVYNELMALQRVSALETNQEYFVRLRCAYIQKVYKKNTNQKETSKFEMQMVLVMEYGKCSLNDILKMDTKLKESDVVLMIKQILKAGAVLQELGMAQSDQKPANLIFTRNMTHFAIADLGETVFLNENEQLIACEARGSPIYMSPQLLADYSYRISKQNTSQDSNSSINVDINSDEISNVTSHQQSLSLNSQQSLNKIDTNQTENENSINSSTTINSATTRSSNSINSVNNQNSFCNNDISQQYKTDQYDPIKSDAFSIGIVISQLLGADRKSMLELFQSQNNAMVTSHESIKKYLSSKEFKSKYPNLFQGGIQRFMEKLLEFDETKRFDFKQASEAFDKLKYTNRTMANIQPPYKQLNELMKNLPILIEQYPSHEDQTIFQQCYHRFQTHVELLQFKEALVLSIKMLKAAEDEKNDFLINMALQKQALCHLSIGSVVDQNLAIGLVKKSQQILSKLIGNLGQADMANKNQDYNDTKLQYYEDLANSYELMGNILCKLAKFSEAIKNLKEAEDIRRSQKTYHQRMKATYYNNIGLIYKQQQNLAKAKAKYLKALKIMDGLKILGQTQACDLSLTSMLNNNLANTMSEMGDFEEALEKVDIALKIKKSAFKGGDNNSEYLSSMFVKKLILEKLGRKKELKKIEKFIENYDRSNADKERVFINDLTKFNIQSNHIAKSAQERQQDAQINVNSELKISLI